MNRRITDPHFVPWTDENAGFIEPDDESDPRSTGAFWLGYGLLLVIVFGLACLWRFA